MTTRRLGRYEILERIAAGGGGEIYLAREEPTGRQVVVKCVQNLGSRRFPQTRIAMLLEEARIGTIINHPNVVKVFAVDFEDGCFYMVMEQLKGCDLRDVWSSCQASSRLVPVPIIVHLMIEAALGLHAAHECRTDDGRPLNLVHRDISPSNLFVTESGVLKILDFGVAKTAIQLRQTRVGIIKGKLHYMSPEQLMAAKLDRRSDIFSLGAVLHELLSGCRLFKRPDPTQIRAEILEGAIAPPSRIEAPLPAALVAASMRAVERDRARRFQTAKALADTLRQVADTLPPTSAADVALFVGGLTPGAHEASSTEELEPPATVDVTEWATSVLASLEDEVRSTRLDLKGVFSAVQPLAALLHMLSQLGRRLRGSVKKKVEARATGNRRLLAVTLAGIVLAGAAATAILLMPEDRFQPAALRPPDAESVVIIPSTASRAAETKPNPTTSGPASDVVPYGATDTAGPTHERRSQPRSDRREAKSQTSRAGGPSAPARSTASRDALPRPGKLTLGAKPWANVYLGPKLLGPTPLVDLPLPPGEYTFRLVNPESGLERTLTVEIPAGGSVRQNVSLR